MIRTSVLTLALSLALTGLAHAQHAGHGAPAAAPGAVPPQAQQDRTTGGDGDRQGREAGGGSPSTPNPATTAYQAANERMHHAMTIPYTGDADADFARGMIPHHQGAIDMAKVVLEHGKDPELRRLAQTIIADQEKEIAQMQDWLKRAGK